MGRKAHVKCRNAAAVTLDTIANTLPVTTPFDAIKFSDLTGVSRKSHYERIKSLVKDKFITRHPKTTPYTYSMSPKQQQLMLAQHQSNVSRKSRKHLSSSFKPTPKDMAIIENNAHIDHCERILKKAGLM